MLLIERRSVPYKVMKYPTCYIRPKKMDRLVREVVYEEMNSLTSHRLHPDILSTCVAIRVIEYTYRRLDYSLPELLSSFQEIDLVQKKRASNAMRITVDMVPWETVPSEIIERCLDENMELAITDELLEFLKIKPSESIFDKVEFPSRWIGDRANEDLIVSPVYDKRGRRLYNEYYLEDKETGEFRRAIVSSGSSIKTVQEVEYVVDNFGPDSPAYCESTGIDRDLMLRTIHSLEDCISKYRVTYFRHQFIEKFKYKTVAELHQERLAAEKEYAVSRNGYFKEDTSSIWRLVKE